MPLFSRKKDAAVQSFVISFLNENCRVLRDQLEGPRLEGRVNLTLVLTVVPMEQGKPQLKRAFYTTTKEFSSTGVARVLDKPRGLDEALIGFPRSGTTVWLRAKARHLNPPGGGFYQLGMRLTERLENGDCQESANLAI